MFQIIAFGLALAGAQSAPTPTETAQPATPPADAASAAPPAPAPAATPTPVAPSGPIVAYAVRATAPGVTHFTAGDTLLIGLTGGLGGAVDGGVVYARGVKFVRDNKIDDPANSISEGAAKFFADKHQATLAAAPIVDDNLKPDNLAAKAGAAQYVVNAITFGWQAQGSRVFLFEHLQVIDVATKKVILKGKCTGKSGASDEAKAIKDPMADGGAGLKILSALAAEDCLKQLEAKELSH